MQSLPEIYVKGDNNRMLRNVFGCFATGITIVTVADKDVDGNIIKHGMTANSFSSVSLEPPLVSVCIGINTRNYPILQQADNFAINILSQGQGNLSSIFGKPHSDKNNENKFAHGEWIMGDFGAPLLIGAIANIECSNYKIVEAGDHVILLGEVQKAIFNRHQKPLVYYSSEYSKIEKLD